MFLLIFLFYVTFNETVVSGCELNSIFFEIVILFFKQNESIYFSMNVNVILFYASAFNYISFSISIKKYYYYSETSPLLM